MTVNLGEVSRFKLPASAMIDFRTLSIFADVTLYKGTLGANGAEYALHLPRNTAPLIQQITILVVASNYAILMIVIYFIILFTM